MNKNLKVHFSSIKQNWKTPRGLYLTLNKEFQFDFDPCPTNEGRTLHDIDMLGSDWGKVSFVNPPYKYIEQWVKKAHKEWYKGKIVVMLIPSRTDTKWWHDYIMKATEIRFIKGRLRFDDYKNSAPFPSCVVVFK